MLRSHSGLAYNDTSGSVKTSRDTGHFSYLSSDASSNDEEIETELFNDENMFPSADGKHEHIHPDLPQRQSPPFPLTSPQKIHTRPSMRMATEEGARISMFRSRYSQNNPNISSKLSLASSLVDITNVSNMSLLSRRASNVSNQSNQTKRNQSLTDNASSISIEHKRNQIIQRLNKRNSKNLSNPYFYQYKENKQPIQAPPEAPENAEFTFDYGHSRMMSSTFGSFSDVLSDSPEKSTEESLNFNDLNPIRTHKIFTISEDKDTNHSGTGQFSHSNEERNSRNENHNYDNSRNRSMDENHGGYADRSPGNNSSDGTSHSHSHHSSKNNNSGNRTDSSKNTTSGDETTSSEEREASRKIRLSQQSHGGLFSELRFTPVTAAAANAANAIAEEPQQQNEEANISKSSDNVLSEIEDDSNFVDLSNSELFRSRESFATVSTGQIQTVDLKLAGSDNSSNSHHFAVLAQPVFTSKLLTDDSANSPQCPTITVNAMNTSDGSMESRLRNFNLSNNSSVSMVTASQTLPHPRSETVLDLNAEQSSKQKNMKKKHLFRKPPPTSPSPSPSGGDDSQTTNNNNVSARSFPPNHDEDATSNLIRNVKQSNNKNNLKMAPIVPKFPSVLYSDHDNFIELNSDDTDTTMDSNGSREQLLSHSYKKQNAHLPKRPRPSDLEKGPGALVSDDYKREYHNYELNGRCSDKMAILLLLCSLLAPPFFLIIALGYLDRIFGGIAKKYKIVAAVGFGVFCLGSVVGIAVGFGYGLTHGS